MDSSVHTASTTPSSAERLQRLLRVLACPRCNRELGLVEATFVHSVVADAGLECAQCGAVGVIRTFRPTFHESDLGDAWCPGGLVEAPLASPTEVDSIGDWVDVPAGWLGTTVGSCLTGSTTSDGIVVELATHTWGAAVLVAFADQQQRVELRSSVTTAHRVVIHAPNNDQLPRRWSVVIVPGSERATNPEQAIVRSVSKLERADSAVVPPFLPENLGNPYPPRFETLLKDAPPEAVVIDVGGGDRRHGDARVLNFEYLKFPNADFFGDGLHLPIASNSVDLILSQAVLEHVPDPAKAVAELYRILRPGGRIFAEFAFMQPLHAVPFHFFNITPHGADLLFEGWDVHHTGVFGGLQPTLTWFFALLDADAKLGQERTSAILSSLGELDSQLSEHELSHIASAVFVEATKPAA